jgi:sulfate adenylyltransferase subunit 1
VFAQICEEFNALTRSLGWDSGDVQEIPVSALHGDNVATRSENTPYYSGPTLIEHLESVPVDADVHGRHEVGLRMPVQYVIRPRTADHPDYRGYAGQIAAGSVRPGDEIAVLPSGIRTTVERIDTADGELDVAHAGRSVTLILADDIDVSRGDILASPVDAPEPISEFEATVCWLAEKPLRPGARLLLKHGARTTQAIVGALEERFDEQNLTSDPNPETLELNEIARISIRVAEPIAADDYKVNRRSGSFLLIDPAGGNTLAAGLVGDGLAGIELGNRVPA